MSRSRTLAVTAFLLALVAAGCGSAVSSQAPSAPDASPAIPAGFASTQRNEGGDVTVEVTWDALAAGAVFDVTLDTHSVDLDGFDLSDAVLTNDRGEGLAARPWEAPKGGHHRTGRMAFTGDAATFLAEARWVELTISGVGAVPERVLRWEFPA